MKNTKKNNKNTGTVINSVIIILLIAALLVMTVYYMTRKNLKDSTLNQLRRQDSEIATLKENIHLEKQNLMANVTYQDIIEYAETDLKLKKLTREQIIFIDVDGSE